MNTKKHLALPINGEGGPPKAVGGAFLEDETRSVPGRGETYAAWPSARRMRQKRMVRCAVSSGNCM
jgi:hypothetical protein